MISIVEQSHVCSSSGTAPDRERQFFHRLSQQRKENELARSIATGDLEARNRLVEANLGLAIKIAREFRGRGLDLDDLIGEGYLGLIRRRHFLIPALGCDSARMPATGYGGESEPP